MTRFRLLDSGARTAAWNMAADQVLLEACAAGTSPPTLRFMRMSPPAVLVGAFQRVENEVRERTGLAVSVGIAPVKMVAKIASGACKPDGLLEIPEGVSLAQGCVLNYWPFEELLA